MSRNLDKYLTAAGYCIDMSLLYIISTKPQAWYHKAYNLPPSTINDTSDIETRCDQRHRNTGDPLDFLDEHNRVACELVISSSASVGGVKVVCEGEGYVVAPLSSAAFLSNSQSNSATRLCLPLREPFSCAISSSDGKPERRAISSHCSS